MSKIIKGIVVEKDGVNKESLPGVNVVLTSQSGQPIKDANGGLIGTSTNGAGGYILNVPLTTPPVMVPLGAYIKASFVRMKSQVQGIDFNADRQPDIVLQPSSTELNEVVITAPKKEETIPAKVSMTLKQEPIKQPVEQKKGWASFSKMKKGLIIGGASLGVILLIIGISVSTKKE